MKDNNIEAAEKVRRIANQSHLYNTIKNPKVFDFTAFHSIMYV
jgi:hypothetical protein